MAQLLVHISENIAHKFKVSVPAKQRSKYIENLLKNSLLKDDEKLLNCAKQIEKDPYINDLISDFENISGDDIYG